jgi:hypothetical protein
VMALKSLDHTWVRGDGAHDLDLAIISMVCDRRISGVCLTGD